MTEPAENKDDGVSPDDTQSVTDRVVWEQPEGYAENLELIETHLEPFFGPNAIVFHEIVSDLVHLDVLVFEPTGDRDFWVYVTSGMGDIRMTVPEGVDPAEIGRAELMIGLPRDWGNKLSKYLNAIGRPDVDNVYWPIKQLKSLARYPHLAKTFLTHTHTIQNEDEQPYSSNSRINGAILAYSTLLPEGADRLTLPDGDKLNFLGVTYLFPEEMDFKLQQGAEALFERLNKAGVNEVLDIKRQSVVRKSLLMRLLKGE